MDNLRFVLLLALAVLAMMLWDAWQRDYAEPKAPATVERPAAAAGAEDAPPPADDLPDIPPPAEPAAPGTPSFGPSDTDEPSDLVTLESDVLRLKISPRGASIVRAELLEYPVDADAPDRPFVLLDQRPDRLFVADTGVLGSTVSVDHHQEFRPQAKNYRIEQSADRVSATFTLKVDGLEVTKTITLPRGGYLVETRFDVVNEGRDPWAGRLYQQLKRTRESGREGFIYTFTGAALSTPDDHYRKFSFDDMEDQAIAESTTSGWIAYIQHYFLAAIVPPKDTVSRFYSKAISEDLFAIGAIEPAQTVAAGETRTFTGQMVVGPKLQERLSEISPHLDLAVDYGWVWFIAKPLFWLLDKIHGATNNWGIAIVLVTCVLKLALFPLSAAGYRSMAKMRKLQPRLVALKERYQGDRQGLNQAMMDLYKKEKVNPLGGCFPILIQIPVFLALYWVLLESVELRQAPFVLWIDDLSSKDPWFVLPVVMGLSMWFQQRLNPTPLDPMQQKVMQIMPVMMTGFFAFFPAGLVLYWVVNNILSIGQQWYITRQIEASSSA